MPFGDRTGPQGQGPMTGRGAGYCSGVNAPGFATAPGRGFGRGGAGFGRGFGRGAGFGRGRGGWGQGGVFPAFPAQPYVQTPIAPEQEVGALKAQAAQLQDTLQRINDRLDELEK
ncbi:MAG: DUF5320 domain-containing protein [Chloroflexota bacterium]|nr:DUF5320 domain-containing protein [Chloroflexota bacterium]